MDRHVTVCGSVRGRADATESGDSLRAPDCAVSAHGYEPTLREHRACKGSAGIDAFDLPIEVTPAIGPGAVEMDVAPDSPDLLQLGQRATHQSAGGCASDVLAGERHAGSEPRQRKQSPGT
jgi:hypothetical protein